MRPTYVSASGNVIRRDSPEFSCVRLLLASLIVIILYATNPANKLFERENETLGGHQDGSWTSWMGSLGPDWFANRDISRSYSTLLKTFSNISSRISATETNYVLFSLQNDVDGVYIGGLMNQYPLCQYYGRFDIICGWIGDNLCHGMKAFDPLNRPFTFHRILETLLIGSIVLSACAKYGWRGPVASLKRPWASFLSVLSFPSIVEDLISLNIFIYPALVAMDRIVAAGSPNTNAASKHFYLSASALAFGIGGLSNMVASALSGEGLGGMHGARSGALGYLLAIAPSKVIITYLGVSLYASDILLGMTILGFINMLFGYAPFIGSWRRGSIFAWVAGGIAGNLMAQFHIDRYGLGWFPF